MKPRPSSSVSVPAPRSEDDAWARWGTWWLPLGPVLVASYATVMVLTILVLEPLAAMPGMTPAQISAALAAEGMTVAGKVPFLVGWAVLGVALSVAACAVALRRRVAPDTAVALQLAVLALGAPAFFWGGFDMGMDLADTFGIVGGYHSAVPPPLYAISGWALAALVVLQVPRVVRLLRAGRG
ncbi:hypothetical protein [Krasilnikoviella flava]|uniref:Uncharacterized protein n=1 Tax=Krasilnikoviella flava TaxID=526729 RepID=A0A1T5IQC1_9MICO|nr:hypothetical protein [Krasilnikoviella flava]SKC41384.1 hypothetical protein SAMN04324258_0807 [Krasilnikoviella flava]